MTVMINNITKNSELRALYPMQVPNPNTPSFAISGFSSFLQTYSIKNIPHFMNQFLSQHQQDHNLLNGKQNNPNAPPAPYVQGQTKTKQGNSAVKARILNSVMNKKRETALYMIRACLNAKIQTRCNILLSIMQQEDQEDLSKSSSLDNQFLQQPTIIRKNWNQGSLRKNSILRKITERDQETEDAQFEDQINRIVVNLKERALPVKKEGKSFTKAKIVKALGNNFRMPPKETKTKLQQQPFNHDFELNCSIQQLPRKIYTLQQLQPLIGKEIEIEGQFQAAKSSPLKYKIETPKENSNEKVGNESSNHESRNSHILKDVWILPNTPLDASKGLSNNLTYFGSEAIYFKNSLIKQRQTFKQKPQKYSHIQQIERKSMPVKIPNNQLREQRREQNEQGKKKVVKLKAKIKQNCSRYQQPEQFVFCSSTMSCFGPNATANRANYNNHVISTEEKSISMRQKTFQNSFGINSDLCVSSQIKDSVASTTLKTSSYDLQHQADETLEVKRTCQLENNFYREKSLSCANKNISLSHSKASNQCELNEDKNKFILNSHSTKNSNAPQIKSLDPFVPQLLNFQHTSYRCSPQSSSMRRSKDEYRVGESPGTKVPTWRNCLVSKRSQEENILVKGRAYDYCYQQMHEIQVKMRKDMSVNQKLKYKTNEFNRQQDCKRIDNFLTSYK